MRSGRFRSGRRGVKGGEWTVRSGRWGVEGGEWKMNSGM